MTDAAWTKVLKKVKSSIEIHLTRLVRSHITEKMTAHESWEKLENVYMGKTMSNELFLKDELFGLRLEEGGDIEDHVCRFQNCITNLQKVEETYKDDDMAIILLRYLPPSFKHFRTALIFGKESMKLEDEKIKEEKTGNKGRSKSKKKKEKKEGCFECGSADHWKRNCKIWKEKKAKMEGSSGSASAVTEHESDGELLSVTSGSKAFINWILDTGCTFQYYENEVGYGYKSKKGRLRVAKGSLVVEDKTELWHHRLGHISHKALKASFTSSSADNRSKEQLSYIHSNVWGLAPTKSNGGARYFVTFMDDFSRKVWVYFMKQKSKVFAKFKEWKTETENQTGRKIKYLRSDNGGEYTSNEFTDYCKQEGIIRHFTVKKNPQQNGAAERMNQTLMEREREKEKGACDFMQDCLIVFGQRLVFGCSPYAHIPSDERSKLKPKFTHCIFLGFEKGVKGFKLWDINNRKKVVSRDVVFDETTMPLNKVKSNKEEALVEQIEQDAESDGFEEEEEHQHRSPVRNQVEQETRQFEGTLIRQTSRRVRTPTNNPLAFQRCIALDKPNRNKKKPDRFGFNQDEVNYALNISQGDPTTYREAIASDERDSWISAMTEEMESLYKNSV
ncbi:unnamed protein product [Prunus armeniaca]